MLIAGEIFRSFPETIFGRSQPQGSPFMPNIEQNIRPNNSQSDRQLNRDFWNSHAREEQEVWKARRKYAQSLRIHSPQS
jgi:hypothetical protein